MSTQYALAYIINAINPNKTIVVFNAEWLAFDLLFLLDTTCFNKDCMGEQSQDIVTALEDIIDPSINFCRAYKVQHFQNATVSYEAIILSQALIFIKTYITFRNRLLSTCFAVICVGVATYFVQSNFTVIKAFLVSQLGINVVLISLSLILITLIMPAHLKSVLATRTHISPLQSNSVQWHAFYFLSIALLYISIYTIVNCIHGMSVSSALMHCIIASNLIPFGGIIIVSALALCAIFFHKKSVFSPVQKIDSMTHVVNNGDVVSRIGSSAATTTLVMERLDDIHIGDQSPIHYRQH